MSGPARRVIEAILGLCVLWAAVSWLSGGCGSRVAPGVAEIDPAAAADGELATVGEVTGPAIEWASGEVASARDAAVASRVLARIERVEVSAGDLVSTGDLLIALDARDLQSRVGAAAEVLRSARARLELAEREHERTLELVRTGVAPERRLDQTRAELTSARADVAGRQQALADAETGASFAEIRAPVSGRVVDRMAEPGDTAVAGRPLLRIYDPMLLRVEAPVRESLAVQLRVGDRLPVEVPAVGEAVEGRIEEIVPFAERGSRTLLVKVTLPRSEARVFAGMFARVAVPAGERRRLVVPSSAIQRVGQLEFAQVLGPADRWERRLVTTGDPVGDDRIEVLSGLAASERVRLELDASVARRSN